MRKLVMFNHVSLDGYFVDARGNMQWAKADPADAEWSAFVAGNAGEGGALVFGRITYEMMAGFWPTPAAITMLPDVAAAMNAAPKIVFSCSLTAATWSNTTLVADDPVGTLRRMKAESGPDLVILGSGRIVAQLAPAGLIDEYQIVVNPVVLGAGRTLFEGISRPIDLQRTRTRAFGNGKMLLCYEPRTPA